MKKFFLVTIGVLSFIALITIAIATPSAFVETYNAVIALF